MKGLHWPNYNALTMSTRRDFIRKSAATAGAFCLAPITRGSNTEIITEEPPKLPSPPNLLSPSELAMDEQYWMQIREQFTVSPNIINLNNGGVSPQPLPVQNAHIRNYEMSNEGPSYYMWRVLDMGREPLRTKLANLAGCSAEEIAINRNSTEGLNTIIFGLNLKAGDEVVISKYDYPNMINAWKQREKREGIVLKWVELDLPFDDDEYIVKKYADAITSKTKILHLIHVINWTGQVLPVKKISDMAHAKGCEVLVDGAHSFAHIDFNIPDTGADYFATSLHKWLCAPFGSGLLYIRKEKIKNIWALLSNNVPDGEDIRKFESLGTRSFASEMAIGVAVDFHTMIGSANKEARLRYLKDYWVNKVKNLPGFKLHTSLKPTASCAIANFTIEGWKSSQIDTRLFDDMKVHTVGIDWEKVNGVRVTPHIYTSLYDLDQLVTGIEKVVASTPPQPR